MIYRVTNHLSHPLYGVAAIFGGFALAVVPFGLGATFGFFGGLAVFLGLGIAVYGLVSWGSTASPQPD